VNSKLDHSRYGENGCEAGKLNILIYALKGFCVVIVKHNISIAVESSRQIILIVVTCDLH
jgi:hypothetical protein